MRLVCWAIVGFFHCGCAVSTFDPSELAMASPADIINSERPLESLLDFPESQLASNVLVQCKTWVDIQGLYFRTFCYALKEEENRFVHEVLGKMDEALATPAIVGSKHRVARVLFSVMFDVANRGITVFPSHRADTSLVGPQRLVTNSCLRDIFYDQFSYTVSAEGTVTAVSIAGKRLSDHRRSVLEKCWSTMQFIPGTVNGARVTANVIEVLFDNVHIDADLSRLGSPRTVFSNTGDGPTCARLSLPGC